MQVLAQSNQLYMGDMLFYLISFIIMALLVWHFAWNPVTQMMKKRADKIANDIDDATNNRKEAAKLAAQRQEELKVSKEEATKIVDDARKNGQNLRSQIIDDAHNDARTIQEQAQRDAEQARQDALKGAKDDVANLSIEIASKLIKKQLNADDQQELIDSYIEGLVKHES
ncbi:MAG TPA: F0F1 ATP synthase subunit B [Candidatus Limosilactobacillus merdigallinarum]|uniref:ATP synthase subunit b n=1 Tax=Candidatus Limosilactobacillus merdigallinarum TaxID=2838652 RepID=A0A9D2ALF8_9LACO|nr:F0F1 ATP synthase subunit B [Candidatus Limosilactobacillus merdigallinarum]